MTPDLLNYGPITQRYLERINEDPTISNANKQLLIAFHGKLLKTICRKGKPVEASTVQKNTQDAFYLAQLLGKRNFEELVKSRISFETFENEVKERWTNPTSQAQRLKCLLKIFKLMFEKKPKWIKEMKTGEIQFNPPHPNQIFNSLEMQKIIQEGCTTSKQKAMACILREGVRPAEFFRIKFEDITDDGEGRAIINIRHSKTGRVREVPTRRGYVYLKRWLQEHPSKTNSGFLFSTNKGERLSYNYLMASNREWFERARVPKERSRKLYFWRKSAITNWCSDGGSLRVGAKIFDTSYDYMQKTYDSVNKEDTNKEVDLQAGIRPTVKPRLEIDSELARVCSRCKSENYSTEKNCVVCGWELNKSIDNELLKKEIANLVLQSLLENGLNPKNPEANGEKIRAVLESIKP